MALAALLQSAELDLVEFRTKPSRRGELIVSSANCGQAMRDDNRRFAFISRSTGEDQLLRFRVETEPGSSAFIRGQIQ